MSGPVSQGCSVARSTANKQIIDCLALGKDGLSLTAGESGRARPDLHERRDLGSCACLHLTFGSLWPFPVTDIVKPLDVGL